MRALALDYLIEKIGGTNFDIDPEFWYQDLREKQPKRLFPYLVEDSGKLEKVYILEPESEDVVRITVQDIVESGSGCRSEQLPFMRPPGSRSAQIGPVLKRSYDNQKGARPTEKTINTTMKSFEEIAEDGKPWSPYFAEVIEILKAPQLKLLDGTLIDWQQAGFKSMLSCAIEKIGQQSGPVFLTVRDYKGNLPGDALLYLDYLMQEKLAGERYVTKNVQAIEGARCPLCDKENTVVYPNAVKGAGINLLNVDRVGRFPGIDEVQAWKAFALCNSCADLLYVFKFHVLKKVGPRRDRQPFMARIAGDLALIIPHFLPNLETKDRQRIQRKYFREYLESLELDAEIPEEKLLDIMREQEGLLNIDILWATVGQEIGDVTGMITHVLPSRLSELSRINAYSEDWSSVLFPTVKVETDKINLQPSLTLYALKDLFYRQGGRKNKSLNNSSSLISLKRQLAACVYYQRPINETLFWNEWLTTARSHVVEAGNSSDGYKSLLYESKGKKGAYLTAAGWIKYFTWWLHYFREVGIVEGVKRSYQPGMKELEPYFGLESGIDSDEKAFAFLLGIIYGKLLQVQGARGVNVSANALTWLKKLTLKGKDLPELYVKTRSKLLAYETEKSEDVRLLLAEVAKLGINLGDQIKLNEVQTSYYLLLGQSVATTVLKSKTKE